MTLQQTNPQRVAASDWLKTTFRTLAIMLTLGFSPLLFFAQVEKPVGINLSPVHDFSTEFVFVDAFQQSRTWISHNADGSGAWDTGVAIPMGENGYPLSIPYDDGINPLQAVRALVLWDLVEPFPSGDYRLIVEGEGQVSLEFGAFGTFSCPVDTLVTISGACAVRIEASNIDNPISDIQLIRPEYVDTFNQHTFTEELLTFLDDFQVIRFMDWLRTNNSPVSEWSDRTSPDYYTQTLSSGVAWEYITELANELGKDIWINIPHQANDAYVTELAGFLQENLSSESDIYLEYSNELWNGIFSQTSYASEMGNNLGFTGPSWEQGWKYTAYRSAQIFSLFETVFEDDDRIIKVIPSQSANPWLSQQLVNYFNDPEYNPEGIEADALAIAPYFAGSVADEIVANDQVNSITVEEIVQLMSASIADAQLQIEETKAITESEGLDLIAYEGGQHLVGTGGNENNDLLTQELTAANHHPDLEQVYCDYLNVWYEESGGLFAHFNSHYPFSKWGSWGLKETMTDFDNPKYQAVVNCVFNDNTVHVPNTEQSNSKIIAYPNPSGNGRFTLANMPADEEWMLLDITGKEVEAEIIDPSSGAVQIHLGAPGMYILRCGAQSLRLLVK